MSTVEGEVVRAMRQAVGLSRQELAESIGCTSGHVGRIEGGTRALTHDIGQRVARAVASKLLLIMAEIRSTPQTTLSLPR